MSLALFVLCLLLQISGIDAAGGQCKLSERSVSGKALKGHTFKQVVVKAPIECQNLCENDRRCLSYNFYIPERLCEMNSKTKEMKPNDFVTDDFRFYMKRSRNNPPAKECQSYTSLTSADRKVTYGLITLQCDNRIGPGWFRFEGSAGTRMPTSCPPINKCDTSAPGWLNGVHPTVADGQVSRTVCFHWTSGYCQWSTSIQVRNCSSFYVYHLSSTTANGQCDLRYCGTD